MASNQGPLALSPDTTHPPNESSDESSATTNIKYDDGELSWTPAEKGNQGNSESHLKDEEIITITKLSHGGYQIFSILPPEMSLNKQPFELRTPSFAELPQKFLELHQFTTLPDWLNPADGKDIHILISTLSGTGLAPDFYEIILPRLLQAIGLEETHFKVTKTESVESVKKFAQTLLLPRANSGHKQTVLMLSGDGGIVDTINGLLEKGDRSSDYTKPTLAQLPLGTGNALFHSLHQSSIPLISSPYIQGLRTLLHGTPKPLPIFSATFSSGARALHNEGRNASPIPNDTLYGAVVASYGLHATLVADSDTTAYRKHGRDRFGIVANHLLFPEDGSLPHAYKADVEFLQGENKTTIPRETHGYVLATLVSNLEKGFTINPESKPLDGQLRVVHFGSTSGAQAMEVMKGAYGNGHHIGMEWEGEEGVEEQGKTMKVGYEAIDGIRISFKEAGEDWKWRRCCIDGLIVGVEEGGWMEVKKVPAGQECVDIVVD